jgi:hypothetical protein
MRCCTKPSADLRMQSAGRRTRLVVLLGFLSAFCILSSEVVTACPFCKESLSSGLAKGYNWSILLMLGVPMLVVGIISGVVWRAFRRSAVGRGRE